MLTKKNQTYNSRYEDEWVKELVVEVLVTDTGLGGSLSLIPVGKDREGEALSRREVEVFPNKHCKNMWWIVNRYE